VKVKLSWISLAVVLAVIAGYVGPRLKYWLPSTPGFTEAARAEQATPEGTANAMFQAIDQGAPSEENPKEALDDRMDYGHMLSGKDMTPDEQKFVALFWDNQRSASIYAALRGNLVRSASVAGRNATGDSAALTVDLQVIAEHGSEWVPYTCTVELRKRGPNWYIDDVKSPRVPAGIYHGFKQRLGSTP
jgi:hypothetical protein